MKNHYKRATMAALFLLVASSVAWGQQTGQTGQGQNGCQIDGQQLKALFDEVRQLRQELRKVSLDTHRLLFLSDQYARQQAKVDGLNKEVERLKTQLGNVDDLSKDEEAVKELETALNETNDPKARVQLVQAHAVFKSALEKQRKQLEEFVVNTRQKLQQTEVNLQEEQEKLSGFKQEMDKLNQELDRLAVDRDRKK